MLWVLVLLFTLASSCSLSEDCLDVSEFTDRWWQAETTINIGLNCYLFSSDGFVVESDGDSNWVSGEWEIEMSDEECDHILKSEDHTLELLDFNDGCWAVKYDETNAKVCECQT